MARVENMTGWKAVDHSVKTGKRWLSGASMAEEVSGNEEKYSGGK